MGWALYRYEAQRIPPHVMNYFKCHSNLVTQPVKAVMQFDVFAARRRAVFRNAVFEMKALNDQTVVLIIVIVRFISKN